MSAAQVRQCGTVCELHWFDTAPEHIHQPPMTLADEELMKARRFAWVKEGVPEGGDPLGPENKRLCLFLFMQDLSRTEVRQMVEVAKAGTDADALEYPCGYLLRRIREMDEDTAAEAWELFGQGLRP